jgi:hypothetical protein
VRGEVVDDEPREVVDAMWPEDDVTAARGVLGVKPVWQRDE